MRLPKSPLAAAGLLLLAIAPLVVNVTRATGSPGSHAAHETSPPQDRAAPLPGTRCTRAKGERCKQRHDDQNNAPVVGLRASEQKITLACPDGATSQTCTPGPGQQVQLQATATDPDGDSLLYSYSATGGRVTGDGAEVTWDLTGLRPGTYTATVEVDDCCGCVAFASAQVKVESCSGCGDTLR